jgi:hypothetical protein
MRVRPAAAAAVLVALSGAGLAAGTAASQRPGLGFGVPRVVDPASNGGEPSLVYDARGRLHVSSIGPAFGNSGPVWDVSDDGGHTFRAVSRLPGVDLNAYTSGQRTETGDTHLGADRHGRTYFSMTSNSSCGQNVTSADGGVTRQASAGGLCALPVAADRQWFIVYDPPAGLRTTSPYAGPRPLIYQTHKTALVLGPTWTRSTDGVTFSPATAGNPAQFRPLVDSFPKPVIDEVTGQVFGITTNFDARNDGAADGVGTNTYLNIGRPDAAGNLTWLDQPGNDVSKLVPVLKGKTASHIKTMGMDAARNLYLVYNLDLTGDYGLYVTTASAATGWRHWSKPVRISDPGTRTNVWPILVAGSAGRVGVAWYGTRTGTPETDAGQPWYLYYAQLTYRVARDGSPVGTPNVQQRQAVSHPVHRGGLCVNGTNCSLPHGTNRSFADFLDITKDAQGRAVIVYNDDIDVPPDPSGVSAYAPMFLVLQRTGISLTGVPLRPSAQDDLGVPHVATFPVTGGDKVPGLTVTGVSAKNTAAALLVDIAVADLRDPAGTAAAAGQARLLRFVARWRMGTQTYYGSFDIDTTTGETVVYSGRPEYPVQYSQVYIRNYGVGTAYPDSAGSTGVPGTGGLTCPAAPTTARPCHVSLRLSLPSVGSPSPRSVLTELGAWSFVAAAPQGTAVDHGMDRNKPILLPVGGVCCTEARP